MHFTVLQVVCLSVVGLMTVAGLFAFVKGVARIVVIIREGAPEPGRTQPWATRLWSVVKRVFLHTEFRGRPAVRAAHWLVALSFPALFGTLVTGYGQIVDPGFVLPLVGEWIPWQWMIEFVAWPSFIAIIILIVVRIVSRCRDNCRVRRYRKESSTSDSAPISEASASEDASLTIPEGQASTGEASEKEDEKAVPPVPGRFFGSTRWQARFVEFVIFTVVLCVLVLRTLEYAYGVVDSGGSARLSPDPVNFPLTFPLGQLLAGSGLSAHAIGQSIVVVSTVKVVVSMAWMIVVGIQVSMGVAWHRFLAFFNLYFRRDPQGGKSLGTLKSLLVQGEPFDVRQAERFGEVSNFGLDTIHNMTWKTRLDLLTCTECGRCQEVCPAWATGKMLSPKLLVVALRDHLVAQTEVAGLTSIITDDDATETEGFGMVQSGLLVNSSWRASAAIDPEADATNAVVESTARRFRPDLLPHSRDVLNALREAEITGKDGVPITTAHLAGEVIPEQMIWDCTTCGACVEACPVGIEHLDHIIDLRRSLVMGQGKLPRELNKPMRGLQSKGNPYNQSPRKRMDWAKKLEIPVPVIGVDVESAAEVDYLLWVGSAGAFDDKARRTIQAVTQLLTRAEVSFGVLGQAEGSSGELARRIGNEALFQEQMLTAIETLNQVGARKVIVIDPHTYNVFVHEYPKYGGNYQVYHHTQILNRLVRDGKLKLAAPASDTNETLKITYHDPCYLGRHNGEYEAPREALAAIPGVELAEMEHNRAGSMCCGAGGGRAFQDETTPITIGRARMEEAAAIGAKVVATGCPYCPVMLGANAGEHKDIELKDVAVLLWESVQRADASH